MRRRRRNRPGRLRQRRCCVSAPASACRRRRIRVRSGRRIRLRRLPKAGRFRATWNMCPPHGRPRPRLRPDRPKPWHLHISRPPRRAHPVRRQAGPDIPLLPGRQRHAMARLHQPGRRPGRWFRPCRPRRCRPCRALPGAVMARLGCRRCRLRHIGMGRMPCRPLLRRCIRAHMTFRIPHRRSRPCRHPPGRWISRGTTRPWRRKCASCARHCRRCAIASRAHRPAAAAAPPDILAETAWACRIQEMKAARGHASPSDKSKTRTGTWQPSSTARRSRRMSQRR